MKLFHTSSEKPAGVVKIAFCEPRTLWKKKILEKYEHNFFRNLIAKNSDFEQNIFGGVVRTALYVSRRTFLGKDDKNCNFKKL